MEQKYDTATKITQSITELIGNTPMIKIQKMTDVGDAEICAKLEWFNVGGSVKDRMALYIIEDAERKGKLKKDKIIIEATSGNTGISYAMIAAMKGYKIEIVLPECVSVERRKIIKAYGAKLILSPGAKGTGGAIELKQKMIAENKDKYVDLNQFCNQANILAHYETTAKEIIEQTDGHVDMVIIGLGTGGTGVGISKRLKEYNKDIKVIGIIPKLGFSVQGLRNPKESFPTELHDDKYFDEIIEITGEEIPATLEAGRDLAINEGLFVGMSSGAAMYVAMNKAKELGKGKRIVVIFPDNGYKYLSTCLFEE
ncbi:MAG: cysteine synthase family protein [Candidatus Aenigmarchaeota archaeon]|nr:cysteine synthase family protein [Candidatus Aenigmarchaeota archaeon]